jgi:acetyl-CoA synthetase
VKGESIVIFARLEEGVAPSPELKKDLAGHIRRALGPVAVPDEVYFVAKLPRTRSGTVMRRVLKAVANNTSIGDLTALEDESSVKEIIKAYQELKGGDVKKK